MQFNPFSSVFIQIPKYSLNFTVVTYFLTLFIETRIFY